MTDSFDKLQVTVEFRNNGEVGFHVVGTMKGGPDLTTRSERKYEVSENRIVISPGKGVVHAEAAGERRGQNIVVAQPVTVDAEYRFESDDKLIFEFDQDNSFGNVKTVTLRRLPDS